MLTKLWYKGEKVVINSYFVDTQNDPPTVQVRVLGENGFTDYVEITAIRVDMKPFRFQPRIKTKEEHDLDIEQGLIQEINYIPGDFATSPAAAALSRREFRREMKKRGLK